MFGGDSTSLNMALDYLPSVMRLEWPVDGVALGDGGCGH